MITRAPRLQQPTETRVVELEISPVSAFGWDFMVEASGRPAVALELTRFRDRATFRWAGSEHLVDRHGFFRPTFTLERGGLTVARAEVHGWVLRGYQVTGGDRQLALRRRGFFPRYVVEQGRSPLGEIRRTSIFRRHAIAQLDERIDPAIQLFLVFLALVEWRHQARRHS